MTLNKTFFFISVISIAFLLGCNRGQLTSGSGLPLASVGKSFLQKTRIISRASNNSPETLLTTLDSSKTLTIPASVLTSTGNRRAETTPYSMTVFVQSIAVSGQFTNGDFYFESPIFSADVEVNSVSTALSLWTRFHYNETPSLSRASWLSMLRSLETQCANCSQKATSEILTLIDSSRTITSNLELIIRNGCPTTLSLTNQPRPSPLFVYSDPALSPSSLYESPLQNVKEDSTLQLTLLFLNTTNTSEKIYPDKWKNYLDTSLISETTDPILSLYLDYNTSGSHTFIAQKRIDGSVKEFKYFVDIGNTNRPPIFTSGTRVTMLSQRENRIAIPVTTVSDPDGDGVNFSLSGSVNPSDNIFGLTIDGGFLVWSPISHPGFSDDQTGIHVLKIFATDNNSEQKTATGNLEIEVIADTPPVISMIDSAITIAEGQSGAIHFSVSDLNNDLICFHTSSIPSIVGGSLPSGSGILAISPDVHLTDDSGSCYKLSSTPRNFSANLMPSYMQTIGTDSDIVVTIGVNYSVQDGYSELPSDINGVARITIANGDDPPSWIVQPTILSFADATNLSEGISFSSSGGKALDPGSTASTISYFLASASSGDCRAVFSDLTSTMGVDGSTHDFFSVNSTTQLVEISGRPNYLTASRCSFKIRAMDAGGLYSDSQTITYDILNVNRNMCWYYVGPGDCPATDPYATGSTISHNGFSYSNVNAVVTELGIYYQIDPVSGMPAADYVVSGSFLNLSLVFRDPDTGDPVTFECVDCEANGISTNQYRIENKESSSDVGRFYWVPGYGSGGTSKNITFKATDEDGTSLTKSVAISIADAPAPMLVNVNAADSSTITKGSTVSLSEPPDPSATAIHSVTIYPRSTDIADLFDFEIEFSTGDMRSSAVTVGNITNTCSNSDTYSFLNGKITRDSDGSTVIPACLTGFNFSLIYDISYSDGNSNNVAVNYKNYSGLSITVNRIDGGGEVDPAAQSFFNWGLRANNTNRSPTNIGLSNSSASQAQSNSSTGSFPVSLTLAQVIGTSTSARTLYLYTQDADATNDEFSFSYPASIKFLDTIVQTGSQAASVTINRNCFTSGSGVNKNITITSSDGRGGSISRTIVLSISGAALLPRCM